MDELEIDGKKYLSSKRAAREHKYHIDYIGQLIRAGKVAGKKVGRSWYVEEASLKSYLLAEAGGAPTAPAAAPMPAQEPVKEETPADDKEEIAPVVENIFERTVAVETPAPSFPPIAPRAFAREEKTEERVVHFNSPVIERKPSTLTYIEDDEPMLPSLSGRVRANADFVAVPMRKTEEAQPQEEEARFSEDAYVEIEPRKIKRTFALPQLQVLGVIAVAVFIVAAVASSLLATSIKVTDGGAASVGMTIK